MLFTLHFAESEKDLPKDWELTMPDLLEGAKRYADFLMSEDQKSKEWESEHPKSLYLGKYYPIVEDIHGYEKIQEYQGEREIIKEKKHVLICLERMIGEQMFLDMKWNSPEVQKAYTEAKTAGSDWYKQFESNPDYKADYLDNLKDRSEYLAESKKIENGVKHGKHENH